MERGEEEEEACSDHRPLAPVLTLTSTFALTLSRTPNRIPSPGAMKLSLKIKMGSDGNFAAVSEVPQATVDPEVRGRS